MISDKIVAACIPLAQALTEKNLRLMPVAGTPLGTLVKAINPLDTTRDGEELSITDIGSRLTTVANRDYGPGVLNEHNVAFDEMVPEISKAVSSHISYARNVVKPFVQRLAEETAGFVKSLTPSSLTGLQVEVFSLPAVLLNSSFEVSVRKHEDKAAASDFVFNILMPDLDEETILLAMATGSSSVDKDMAQWVASQKPGDILYWFHSFFTAKEGYVRAGSFLTFVLETSSTGNVVNLNKVIFLHQMAKYFAKNIPAGLSIPLSVYENTFADLEEVTGAMIVEELDRYNSQVVTKKRLVRAVRDTVIEVYENVYNEFLTQHNGSADILFGLIITRQLTKVYLNDILESKEEFLAGWNRHIALVQMSEANNRFVRTKSALSSIFAKELAEDEEQGLNKETIQKLFDDYLNRAFESDLDNLYLFSLRICCASRFADTDAQEILEGISRAVEANPNLDIREAASLSAVAYIAKWVREQFTVV